MHSIPRDFSNYENELNFECDEEAPCWESKAEEGPSTPRAVEGPFKVVSMAAPTLILDRNTSVRKSDENDCLAH